MNRLLLLTIIGLSLWACTSQRATTGQGTSPPKVVQDSTEYELLVIDPEFDLWFTLHYSPALDRSNDYYSFQNKIGVSNWNYYFTAGRHSRVVESYIDYRSGIDYGIELNRKLYWYFRFAEEKYRIRLLK